MSTLNNSSLKLDQHEIIHVALIDVSETDALKLKKIFQLSSNRKRQYLCSEDNVDIYITANPAYKRTDNKPIISFGAAEQFSDSKLHIKPPFIGIRVLRTLDHIELPVEESALTLDQQPEIKTSKITQARLQESAVLSENLASDIAQNSQNTYQVLVVDDSTLIHKALELELNKADFSSHIDYAETGEQCLQLIDEKKYDLIFLDVMMPGIDGYETCTAIRKMLEFKKTPVIMLSAKTSPLDEVKGVMAGCTTYLTKPIKHEEFQKLLTRIDKWLENYSN